MRPARTGRRIALRRKLSALAVALVAAPLVSPLGGMAGALAAPVPAAAPPAAAAPAGAVRPALAAGTARHWTRQPGTPAPVRIYRHDVAGLRAVRLPSGARRVASLNQSTASLVPAPPAGPVQSTWQVAYTGFGSTSNDGPAAKAAFQAAVNIWSRIVVSSVPIKVDADFQSLSNGILGEAGPSALFSDGSTLYPSALVDAIRGAHTGSVTENIDATFSSNPTAHFYYGTDGAPPSSEVDFESVVLHELGHGLGLLGGLEVNSSGHGLVGPSEPMIYDRFTNDSATGGHLLLTDLANSGDIAGQLQSQSVYWGGDDAVASNGGVRPKLYAPTSWQSGSSYSHLDEDTYPIGDPNSLMTPAISAGEAVHSPGPIAVGMLIDEGWSAELPGLAAKPDAPTGLVAVAGPASANLSWTAADGNGLPITGYLVYSGADLVCGTSGATSCRVGALTDGTSYTFTVVAESEAGRSAHSAASNAVVPADVPGQATKVVATRGDQAASVTWSGAPANGSAITGYVATANPGNETCTTTGATGCTVTGLTNGTSYSVTVVATNGLGAGPASAASSAVVPAGRPTPPTAVGATPGNTTAVVSWTAAGSNGAGVSGYTVTSSPDGLTCAAPYNGTSCTVPDLTNGTAYTFTVVAANAVGVSLASDPSPSVTPVGPPPAVPGAPSTPFVHAGGGDGSVLVAWSPPSFDGGRAITGYDIQVSADEGATWVSAAAGFNADTAQNERVTGLTDGLAYVFRVAAVNAVGFSAYSAASAPAVPFNPVAPNRITLTAGRHQTISAGRRITVRTTVFDVATDAGLADESVVLAARARPGQPFTPVRTVRTRPDGVAVTVVTPTTNTQYRWTHAASTSSTAATSPTQNVWVAQAVSIAMSVRAIGHHQVVRLFGTVRPAVAGVRVILQRRIDGHWRSTSRRATLRVQKLPNGHRALGYVIAVPRALKGRHTYRIYRAATSRNLAGGSASIRVTTT